MWLSISPQKITDVLENIFKKRQKLSILASLLTLGVNGKGTKQCSPSMHQHSRWRWHCRWLSMWIDPKAAGPWRQQLESSSMYRYVRWVSLGSNSDVLVSPSCTSFISLSVSLIRFLFNFLAVFQSDTLPLKCLRFRCNVRKSLLQINIYSSYAQDLKLNMKSKHTWF